MLALQLVLQHLQRLGEQTMQTVRHPNPQLLSATVQRGLEARVMMEPLADGLPGYLNGRGRVCHRLAAGQEGYGRFLLRSQAPVWSVGIRLLLSGHTAGLL